LLPDKNISGEKKAFKPNKKHENVTFEATQAYFLLPELMNKQFEQFALGLKTFFCCIRTTSCMLLI